MSRAPPLVLGLNLAPVKSAHIPSHQEVTEALFASVDVILVLPITPNGAGETELRLRCTLGDSLQTFVERLVSEHGFFEPSLRLYLERREPSCYMMDPLSLNDFARVRTLAAQGHAIRILVEGHLA